MACPIASNILTTVYKGTHTHTYTYKHDTHTQAQLHKHTHLHTYIGLARNIYIRCIYSKSGREMTRYTVIYGVYVRFWPAPRIQHSKHPCTHLTHTSTYSTHNTHIPNTPSVIPWNHNKHTTRCVPVGVTVAELCDGTVADSSGCWEGCIDAWREGGCGEAAAEVVIPVALEKGWKNSGQDDEDDVQDWPSGTVLVCHYLYVQTNRHVEYKYEPWLYSYASQPSMQI